MGNVRSAREYYISLAYGHDAIYLHADGSPQAYISIRQWGHSTGLRQRTL